MKRGLRFPVAMAVSCGIHAAIALVFAWFLARDRPVDVAVEIDLSSVELSVAERDEDAAAVMPVPASPPADPIPPEVRPPERMDDSLPPLPPEPFAVPIPEPPPEQAKLTPPPEPTGLREKPVSQAPSASIPEAASRQARVDAPPRPRRAIRPDYPASARRRGEQGETVVELTVLADGSVGEAQVAVSSGFSELDAAALKAVRNARFVPARSGDRPVASTARLTLKFRLKD